MSEKIYYIKGSPLNPEGVKQALLEVCPNAENIDDFAYSFAHSIDSTYYYVINGRIDYAEDDSRIELLKAVGIELEAKKIERFVEETMYQSIYVSVDKKGTNWVSSVVYPTVEDAMSEDGAVGYIEVKVMKKEK